MVRISRCKQKCLRYPVIKALCDAAAHESLWCRFNVFSRRPAAVQQRPVHQHAAHRAASSDTLVVRRTDAYIQPAFLTFSLRSSSSPLLFSHVFHSFPGQTLSLSLLFLRISCSALRQHAAITVWLLYYLFSFSAWCYETVSGILIWCFKVSKHNILADSEVC